MDSIIATYRNKFHRTLLDSGVLSVDKSGIPSNADRASKLSIAIASGICQSLMADTHEKSVGQTSGAKFEQLTMEYIAATFPLMNHMRPGRWHIAKLGNRNSIRTSSFA